MVRSAANRVGGRERKQATETIYDVILFSDRYTEDTLIDLILRLMLIIFTIYVKKIIITFFLYL